MIKRHIKNIEKMSGGKLNKVKYSDEIVRGICTDTRSIEKGNLFIPLIGENFNGHKFIDQAIDNGASSALWNKDEALPDIDFPFILVEDTLKAMQNLAHSYLEEVSPKVIGITGSNGKTSTKDILASLLKTQYKTHKTRANLNNGIGLPLTILAMDEDTEMLVLEMGMDNFGQIKLLTKIAPPDAAVITNIGTAHLEGLKTAENIARAKLEILAGLKVDKLFLYYGDDPMLKSLVEGENSQHEIKSFGMESLNDFQPEIISINGSGANFRLKKPKSDNLFLPMLGEHQVLNATAAIAIAEYFHISSENINKGLAQVEKTGMRNELVKADNFTILDDSYKSNPESVRAALKTLYSIEGYSEKIAILGDMLGLGDDEIQMHREIGREITKDNLDYLFTIGEFGEYISETARINFPENKIFHFEDKDLLVKKVKEIIKKNSLVLVKASRPLAMEEVVEKLKNLSSK